MKKNKSAEALLVIVTGFILLFIVYKIQAFLYISLSVGLIGVFIKPLGNLIALGWYKLGELMGFVVSKIVLTLMFYLLLVPIALLHNLMNKDKLNLKRRNQSTWHVRNHKYLASDLKNIW